MSSAQERQAGTSGSTMGYEPGQAPTAYPQAGRHEATAHRGAVVGFTATAGVLMLLVGLWDVTVGIVALSSSHYYVKSPTTGYTYRWSLHGWGWAELIFGCIVFAAGVCVFLGMAWARWLGAILAVVGAVGQFMLLPFTPLWSILVIALYGFIIWALLHPREEQGQF